MRTTELQQDLYGLSPNVLGEIEEILERSEREPLKKPLYQKQIVTDYEKRQNYRGLMNEGTGALYQDRRLFEWLEKLDFNPKNIYENVKRHPLVAGTLLGSLSGAASFAGYTASTIPYTLSAGTAFATVGSLGLGALVGGLFGLGIAGALHYVLRGKRKYIGKQPNPQYNPKEARGLWKWGLDWITERNIEADQAVAGAAQRMPRG